MEFQLILKFTEQFGGAVFYEEPGDRVIYEKDGRCYSLPENYLDLINQSLAENKNYLLDFGTAISYDPDVIY